MIEEAIMTGVWFAFGSTMGKLSGTPAAVRGNDFLWCFYVILMIIANTFSSNFLHSLDVSSNSSAAIVIASASSYLLSGIIGIVVFNEIMPFQWWIGTSFILHGITIIAKQKKIK